eukprot:GHUV01011444.1.p1 GENE.GHUV01011444.1~~GHUV01011444.1.p1  ORF type:complete len:1219 (+),score=421.40 GHUV01011444.1:689-4345(+)
MRRTKHNPVLIGEAGVGKTAIVEGIAQLVAAPQPLRGLEGKKIIALDVASVVAGSTYRGEFEERLQSLLQDCETAAGSVVLFIDEIHVLVGAGNVEGGLDFANMLKPALARSQLQVIGATTLDEYRQHIETDPALSRRFQPVLVEEPSPQECLELLSGLAPRYEAFHHVAITQQALETAVLAAQRYVPERRLPDSAIDLLDEAAAKVRLAAHVEQQYQQAPTAIHDSSSRGGGNDNTHKQDQVKSDISSSSTEITSNGPQGTSTVGLSMHHGGSTTFPGVGEGSSSIADHDRAAEMLPVTKQQRCQQGVFDKVRKGSFAADLAGQGFAVESSAEQTVGAAVIGMQSSSDSMSSTSQLTSPGSTVTQAVAAATQQVQLSLKVLADNQQTAAGLADTAQKGDNGSGADAAPAAAAGSGADAAPAAAAAQTWSDWITAHGWRGESEVHKQRLLEWFGSSPAQPLKGAQGHRQTTVERRKKHAQLFGSSDDMRTAAVMSAGVTASDSQHNSAVSMNGLLTANSSADVSTVNITSNASSTVAQTLTGNFIHQHPAVTNHELHLHPRSCPHCGALVTAMLEQLKLQCHNCGFRFLNLAPEKLQLGTTVVLDKQQQHTVRFPGQRQGHVHSMPQSRQAVADEAASLIGATATAVTSGSGKQVIAAVKQSHPQHDQKPAAAVTVFRSDDAPDMGWSSSTTHTAKNFNISSSSSRPPGRPEVTARHVLEVVTEATGVPIALVAGSIAGVAPGLPYGLKPHAAAATPGPAASWAAQQAMLQELSDIHSALTTAVLGQDAAAAAIIGALRLSRLGLHHSSTSSKQYQQQQGPGRPALSLLLTGPSGVGKSSMARVLAERLMPGEPYGVLFMSCGELAERHSISRLVGAPPGYVERAHPDIVGLLLQAVEDGRLMDSLGHNINLRSATFLFTANTAESALATAKPRQTAILQSTAMPPTSAFSPAAAQGSTTGLRQMHTSTSAGFSIGSEGADYDSDNPAGADYTRVYSVTGGPAIAVPSSQAAEVAAPAPPGRQLSARAVMISDIASRVDDVIEFEPLAQQAMFAIVQQQLQEAVYIARQQGVHLQVTDNAAAWLASAGGSAVSGARRVSQLIRRHVMVPLADAVVGALAEQHACHGRSEGGASNTDIGAADAAAINLSDIAMPRASGAGAVASGTTSIDAVCTVAWATAVLKLAAQYDGTADTQQPLPADTTQRRRPLQLHLVIDKER